MATQRTDDERRGLVVVHGVAGGDAVATRVALLAQEGEYEVVVATRAAATDGTALPVAPDDVALDALFDEAHHAAGAEFEAIEHVTREPFDGWLGRHGVTALDLVGEATDDGVLTTALHAVRAGFAVRVLEGALPGAAAVQHLRAAGVEVVAGLGDV
jgi:nicotinamidase-related amidase